MESAIIMTGFPLGKGGHNDRTGRTKRAVPELAKRVLAHRCEARTLAVGVTQMRTKLAVGALGVGPGSAAAPVFAQTAG